MITGTRFSVYLDGAGRLVEPGSRTTLAELDPAEVLAALADSGYLVLRGFEPTLESFSAFVKKHSSRVTLDPARSFHGGAVAQKVDAGYDSVGLHIENGNSPFSPTLTWFFCEKAASSGSQTTVCDGYDVWDLLSSEAKDAFGRQDIVYTRRVEEAKWKAFASFHLDGDPAEVKVEDLRELTSGDGATTITENPDKSIVYSYRVPAAHRTLFGSRVSFANSILGPSNNYETPRISFADDTDIPVPLLEEIATVTEKCTGEVAWNDGEVVIVDNTRVMHGRRAIVDPKRTIYNAQSYADLALI